MSKAEILRELPRLPLGERREIFERIVELEDQELLKGGEPTPEEKALLDRELEEYQRSPDAGSSWEEVKERVRKPTRE
jgi:putative addiction module component (TIGR02574 family)